MENIILAIFLGGFIVLIPMLLIYIRTFSEIVSYSNSKNMEVLGNRYENVYKLYADVGFLNELWTGANILEVKDNTMKVLLSKARGLLLAQLGLGFAMFILILLNGIIQ